MSEFKGNTTPLDTKDITSIRELMQKRKRASMDRVGGRLDAFERRLKNFILDSHRDLETKL